MLGQLPDEALDVLDRLVLGDLELLGHRPGDLDHSPGAVQQVEDPRPDGVQHLDLGLAGKHDQTTVVAHLAVDRVGMAARLAGRGDVHRGHEHLLQPNRIGLLGQFPGSR